MLPLDLNLPQGTLVFKLRFKPTKGMAVDCSIDGLELFSCALSNEDETALSILDPVSITIDVRPPSSHNKLPTLKPKHTLPDVLFSQTLLVR